MEAKFKLGQTVYLRQALADADTHARVGLLCLPKSFLIYGMWKEECHGGIQHHYVIRLGDKPTRMNESELVDPSEWDISEWVTTIDKARKEFPFVKEWAGQ